MEYEEKSKYLETFFGDMGKDYIKINLSRAEWMILVDAKIWNTQSYEIDSNTAKLKHIQNGIRDTIIAKILFFSEKGDVEE